MRRVVGAVLLAVALVAAPVAAAEAAAPAGLSISIQREGSSEVHAGDSLTYTATVRNDGTDPVDGRLVITVPSYAQITDLGGSEGAGADASWTVTVPAGDSVTKTLTVKLDSIPKEELRVTTLVGLYLGDEAEPTIRSADAATIAGVTDPAHASGDPAAQPDAPFASPLMWVGIGLVVVVIAVVVALVLVRRRRS